MRLTSKIDQRGRGGYVQWRDDVSVVFDKGGHDEMKLAGSSPNEFGAFLSVL